MVSLRQLSIICGLLALPVIPAVAAETESTSASIPPASSTLALAEPLTLSAAVERALEFNPSLRQAMLAVARFEGAYEHASVPVPGNPKLSVESYDEERPGGRVDSDIGISLSQELWIAGQGGLRQRAAGSRLRAAEQRLEFLTSTVAARTRAAFLQALVAQEGVESAQQIVAANQDLTDFSERRLEAGEANQLEANIARIGLGRAEALLARAENEFAQARLVLAELLWLDPAQTIELSGEVNSRELDVPEQDLLLSRAVVRRGDLAAASELVIAAQEELKLARRQLIPNLTVFAVTNSDVNIDREVLAGVSFELPVFHRFGGERKQAAARLDEALLDRDSVHLAIRSQVLSAIAAYRAASRSLSAVSEDVLMSASDNLALTRLAFEAGEVSAVALSTAQDVLINTRNEYLQALNDLVTAGSELERSTGGILIMSNSDPANN